MIATVQKEASGCRTAVSASEIAAPVKVRRAAIGQDISMLTDVYQEATNIVILQRELEKGLRQEVDEFVKANRSFQAAMTLSPRGVSAHIDEMLGASIRYPALSENIAELVDMFCYLFGLGRTGLRLTVLDRAMCPKFHVDRVPCRLVTTYRGSATQWLPHGAVDRSKLGVGSRGLSDDESGLYGCDSNIQQLRAGDVALLKGELWEGNENAGLVHRSPALTKGERRLLLTLDFAE